MFMSATGTAASTDVGEGTARVLDGRAAAIQIREAETRRVSSTLGKSRLRSLSESTSSEEDTVSTSVETLLSEPSESTASGGAGGRPEEEEEECREGPSLGVVLVGARPDSVMYVRMKRKALAGAGASCVILELGADVSTPAVVRAVGDLAATCDGVMVQLPLPSHVDEGEVLDAIPPHQDVDGLTAHNAALLQNPRRSPLFVPCTPMAVLHLLVDANIPLLGSSAVVIGHSAAVGAPVAELLLREGAMITVCTRRSGAMRTRDACRSADVVVVAAGVHHLVRGDWLKPGAAVVDVGIHEVPDATRKSGKRVEGDVCHAEASKVAGFLSPVPGGVGPVTVAMLLKNTVTAWARRQEQGDA